MRYCTELRFMKEEFHIFSNQAVSHSKSNSRLNCMSPSKSLEESLSTIKIISNSNLVTSRNLSTLSSTTVSGLSLKTLAKPSTSWSKKTMVSRSLKSTSVAIWATTKSCLTSQKWSSSSLSEITSKWNAHHPSHPKQPSTWTSRVSKTHKTQKKQSWDLSDCSDNFIDFKQEIIF